MHEKEVIKYPKLSYPSQLGNEVLGKKIFWTEKRDGSNVRCWLDEHNNIQFGSRNMLELAPNMKSSLENTGYIDSLEECLKEHKSLWHSNLIIFFELLQKGYSPTRTENHEGDDIAVFDIYSKEEGWLNYIKIHQVCHEWGIPVVELWGVSKHTSMKTFKKFDRNMLELAKKKEREGYVAKYYDGFNSIFFKNRLDVPDFKQVRVHIEEGPVKYPSLPDAEIFNEIQKVLDELGIEDFKKKEIAMPKIAEYIKQECHQRCCSVPKQLYHYYLKKLEDLQ